MLSWTLAPLAALCWGAEPELILAHGKVFLGPGRYAQAVAVAGNRVALVGTDAEVLALKGAKTRVVDLKGRAVTPGFHDAHTHFLKGALALTEVDLNGAASLDEIRRRVQAYSAANPDAPWILGRGWDQTELPGGQYPTRQDLDAAISTRPVALTDADGHKLWLNTEAIKRAKITSYTPKLVTGEIVKDAKGEPTGVLVGDAMGLARRDMPQPSRADKLAALRRALALARESGVTSVDSLQGPVDFPPEEQLDLWRELYKSGQTTLRFFLYGRLEEPAAFEKLRAKAKDLPRDRVDLVGLKGFVDGALGDRTAALLEPYFDDAKNSGKLERPQFLLNSLVRRAHQAGFQVALHAIGDRAVRSALDACEKSEEKAREEELVLPSYPCRIEHIEIIHPGDLPRFAALRAVASMQPSHMLYDREEQNYNPNRLGERVRFSFAWKSLEDAGALLAFGTDWPVMPLPPRIGLYAATARQGFDGKPDGGWIPRERISLESAVQHYTLDPARALGRGDVLGDIRPGKLADLVVFDRDLFAISGAELLQLQVDMTVFDGRVVFERKPPQP